jgi:deoxyribonuclease V
MEVSTCHRWDVSPAEAILIQKGLAKKVIFNDGFRKIDCVAGVDIGYKGGNRRAAIVVLGYPRMDLVDCVVVEGRVDFPYITGLLSFREIPLLVEAFKKLKTKPDIILADGQGIAHPRRLGLASHLGLVLDSPVIGCAKSRLWGTFQEPGNEKGSFEYLYDKNEVIGAVVRTRNQVKVVFVSIGHKVSLDSSIRMVLNCCTRFRLPEPTRLAHYAASGDLKWQQSRFESLG